MRHPLYVSYFTADTGYVTEAAELQATLEQFNLEHYIQEIPNQGSWQKNTHYKAKFLQEAMRLHPGRALVFIDADARVRQYPALFDTLSCDVAGYHYFNQARKQKELLSGTLYFEPTKATRALLDLWIQANDLLPNRFEQKNLETAMKQVPDLRFQELPASYVLIFDLMADLGPPVIEHTQASRRLKKQVRLPEEGPPR